MTVDYEIKGKVAIVTGASAGMGKAAALALAKQGVNLVLIARNASRLEDAKTEIAQKTGVDVIALGGSVTEPDLAQKAVSIALARWQTIDILINNAGGPPSGSFLQHDDSAWDAALDQNLKSTIRFTRAVAPHMMEKNWGRIISITSTLAKEPSANMVLSATARAGVSAFSKAISFELAPHGITVNTLCPGGVLTDRLQSLVSSSAQKQNKTFTEVLAQSQSGIPLGRFATPEEFADVMVFLASERGRYLTGTTMMVDGGLTRSIF
jgi:3-oxoacyl-[acyl-carrier protein] reductase